MVTIIVPVYNSEQYLPICVESILKQTFKDFELLLVDDGSTDRSGDLCETYAKQDNRIRTYHKKNGGVSSARNLGIRESAGKWLLFVDCDDWLDKMVLENYFLLEPHLETLYIQQAYRYNNGAIAYWPIRFNNDEIILDDVSDYEILNVILYYGTPWGKLYSAEIIRKNNLLFDERLELHEDHCFYFEYVKFIKSVVIIADTGYYYRLNCGTSLSSKRVPWQNLLLAYNKLRKELLLISKLFHLDEMKLKLIYSFVFYIKIRALKAVFYDKNEKRDRIKLLKEISTREVECYYHPISRSAKLFKFILLMDSTFLKYCLLSCFSAKLR